MRRLFAITLLAVCLSHPANGESGAFLELRVQKGDLDAFKETKGLSLADAVQFLEKYIVRTDAEPTKRAAAILALRDLPKIVPFLDERIAEIAKEGFFTPRLYNYCQLLGAIRTGESLKVLGKYAEKPFPLKSDAADVSWEDLDTLALLALSDMRLPGAPVRPKRWDQSDSEKMRVWWKENGQKFTANPNAVVP